MERNVIGICPVCHQGSMVTAKAKFACTNARCGFSLYRNLFGIPISSSAAKEVCEHGESGWIEYKDSLGNHNSARVFVQGKSVLHETKYEYLGGKCPVCGEGIIITSKGFSCVNHVDGNCPFHIPGILSNRKIRAAEVVDFLQGKSCVLDGFSNSHGIPFSGYLQFNRDKNLVYVETIVGKCPLCGGNIRVGPSFYACDNFNGGGRHSCSFKIYRDIAQHSVTPKEIQEIAANGQTSVRVKFYREDGTAFRKRLAVNECGKAIFI